MRCSRNLPAVESKFRGDPLVGLTSPTERHPKRSPLPDVPPQFPAVSGEPPLPSAVTPRGGPRFASANAGEGRYPPLETSGSQAISLSWDLLPYGA
jgi:hypothetical protein